MSRAEITRRVRELERAGELTYVCGGWYRIGQWGPRVQGMRAAIAAHAEWKGWLRAQPPPS